MNIRSNIGSKVIYAYPENGRDEDKVNASNYLNLDQEYTIQGIDVGSWFTWVWLKEVPGIIFNSVQFENI